MKEAGVSKGLNKKLWRGVVLPSETVRNDLGKLSGEVL